MIPMEKEFEGDIFTLVDDDGVENDFIVRLRAEFEGKEYLDAMRAYRATYGVEA